MDVRGDEPRIFRLTNILSLRTSPQAGVAIPGIFRSVATI